ncbi:MAG: 5'/3'-nucleotidase SurE, partial [Planctomycetota bacterium]
VKFAIRHHLDEKPALVVSGPNTGPNVGVNVLYSGTVAAAFEANFWGVSSVAVSSDIQGKKYNWDACCKFGRQVIEFALQEEKKRREHPESHLRHGVARAFLLNLNVPAIPADEILGIKITRHGASGFEEFFTPHISGKENHFSIDGKFESNDPSEGFDASSMVTGYASLSALSYDLTDWEMTEKLRSSL